MKTRSEYVVTVTARKRAELLPVASDRKPLASTELKGRTLATLISPGTELAAYYQGSRFPSTPGYAAVFEVEETGGEVKDVQVGDCVFCSGPHRSFQRVERENAVLIPKQLSSSVAVFTRLMGVSMSTLTTTQARPPELVVVTGLGLVGNLAAQMFLACGYEVLGVDPDARRRELARKIGLERVVPGIPLDDPRIAGQAAMVVDCSGHEKAVLDACNAVRKGGEVVLVGVPWIRRTDLTAHEVLDAVFHRYVILRSGWEWELPWHASEFCPNSLYGNYRGALRWLAEGRVRVEELSVTLPPSRAQQAYQDLLHNRCRRLTVLFDWSK